MVRTHPERFGPPFWEFFDAHVAPTMPREPVIVDLGCGPGLLLHDLSVRLARGAFHGYDVTPAMIAYGRQLAFRGAPANFAVHDVTTYPLPHEAGSVDMVIMSSVLHVVDEPLPVLAEIRRVLAPAGIFLLHDWVRQSLSAYLEWRRQTLQEPPGEGQRRGFRLFPVHNKYTSDDWQWLLAEVGFVVRAETQLRASHRIFVVARQ
jgi:SAM-dependent methyltransferase